MSTDTPAAAPITAEREAFEAWAGPRWRSLERFAALDGSHYLQPELEREWLGWQARAALSSPVAAPLTAEREALAILASFVHEVLMGVYEDDEKKLIHDARRALERSGLLSLDDVVALSAPQQDMNQCDGCKQGAELRNGLHYDRHGKVFMACQRDKYEPPVAAQPAVSGVDALWVDERLSLFAAAEALDVAAEDSDSHGNNSRAMGLRAHAFALREFAEALRTHLSTALTGERNV